jgi:hypothetical protein
VAQLERRRDDSVAAAVRDLAQDVPRLLREEVELAKAEAKAAAVSAAIRAAVLTVAGFLLALATTLLAIAAAAAISDRMGEPWAGPLIVGGGLAVIAAIAALVVLKARGRREPPKVYAAT